MREHARAETPPDTLPLKIKKKKKMAAGIPAVTSSLKHGLQNMGISRTVKTLTMVNQQEGFDCPGCAWPDPSHRTQFEFCENGAKAVADEATKRRVTPEFFSKHSIQYLSMQSDRWLNKQGRITHPMVLEEGSSHYVPITWDDAFSMIAGEVNKLENPNRSVFYTSGRTSNEAAFLYQAMVRSIGTNNLPDCSNMCHESSGKGLGATIGIGKGTVHLDDFNHADVILVIGQNPGTNHPRMLTALRDAKLKGATLIHVNPLPEAGLERFKHPQDYMKMNLSSTQLSDFHLPVKIGGDAALLKGLIKIHDELGHLDSKFIANQTGGFDSMLEKARDTDWNAIVRDSGLPRELISEVGQVVARSKATIACWAMGLTQQPNGVAVIQEVVNLLLMGGHVGRPGAGFCPVRGHSNVQGDRTVGIWEAAPVSFIERMEKGLNISIPREHGYDVVGAIQAMRDGAVDVFFCMGGNFISATPDTMATAEGLRKVGLTVQVSTKLNRSHLVTGKKALILPCLGRTELDVQGTGPQFVSVENSMGIVHRSTGSLPPASSHLRSEPWIVAQLSQHLFTNSPIDWSGMVEDYDMIRNLMEKSLSGFEDYNKRVRLENGFLLPNPPRDSRSFDTPSGRAHFTTHDLPDVRIDDEQFIMMTIRSHDQYNTTIYDVHDRYRGVSGNRRIVLMNALDMAERGWKNRQMVSITSHFEGETRTADGWQLVAYEIPRKNIATYFPEANILVPLRSTAKDSNTPTSKWIKVTLADFRGDEEE
ncbi:FdhF/YdeP family oxidoreductase [Euryarchaeota archaeon]|nr:FdhF/YdeP family oxidoreductase [Euryarchaeota archaeon]MDB2560226.1 FdhF/YdeP family oxidoreductase [Euryarchaeota archaeon]MDB2593585.1 FdhF/YdeP family oxidoreductase [Euryarchaeota archaeon]